MTTDLPPPELELTLAPGGGGAYSLSMGLTRPDDQGGLRSESFRVKLKVEKLNSQAAEHQAYGAALSSALFAHKRSKQLFGAAVAAGPSLRVRLHLPAELQWLRWELLTNPVTGLPLALQGTMWLSRFPGTSSFEPVTLPRRDSLRALVVVAAPSSGLDGYNMAPFDAHAQAEAARAALAPLEATTLLVTGEPGARWFEVSAALADGYDVLYLVAHGTYADGDPCLWVPDETGRAFRLSGATFASLLAAKMPRLVVLASCESAGDGYTYDRSSAPLGPLLASAGVPAVLAMQGRVSIAAARSFGEVFFRELLRDGFVDRALAVARVTLAQRPDGEWWAPVLYTRLRDNRIWSLDPGPDEAHRRAIDLLWRMPLDQPIPPRANLPAPSRVERHTNRLFTGRGAELRQLAQALRGEQPDAVGQAAVITGIGGIGKTELACEFTHRYGQYFAGGVFWLNFHNPDEVPKEVAACGGLGHMALEGKSFASLPIGQQVALVREQWRLPIPRLLIFDNCESEELLSHWRPQTGGCRVLLTSRRSTWSRELGVQVIALGVLQRDESAALLQRHCPRLTLSDAFLMLIAAEVGDLPLALNLAGHFLEDDGEMTAAEYLAELREVALLQHPSMVGVDLNYASGNHAFHVARTFALSFDQLQPQHPVDALAIRLFARLAHFEAGAIVEMALLREAAEVASKDRHTANQAMRRLANLGLLDSQKREACVSLHRLVAQFGRAIADHNARADVLAALRRRMRGEQDEIARRTRAFQLTRLRWLDDVHPFPPADLLPYAELIARYASAPATQTYLADAISALLGPTPAPLSERERASLLVLRAALHGQQGRRDDARKDYLAAERIIGAVGEGSSGDEGSYLRARINLGLGNIARAHAQSILESDPEQAQPFLEEAAGYYRAAVAAARAHGADIPLIAGALGELGYCASLLRRWDEAEGACEEAMKALKEKHGQIDEQSYTHYYASALEAKSLIYWEKAQLSALAADYQAAYNYAAEEIDFLAPWARRERERLYLAHLNAGDYQDGLGKVAGQGAGPDAPGAMARKHWSIALDLARDLGDERKQREVSERLWPPATP